MLEMQPRDRYNKVFQAYRWDSRSLSALPALKHMQSLWLGRWNSKFGPPDELRSTKFFSRLIPIMETLKSLAASGNWHEKPTT